jgi:hypothetical protein
MDLITEEENSMGQHVVITDRDRELAKKCMNCKICNRARSKQRGFAFLFVKNVEGSVCPACKAYKKVYGRKPHEPMKKK